MVLQFQFQIHVDSWLTLLFYNIFKAILNEAQFHV